MTIFVDELRDVRGITGQGTPGLWCHMVTDGALEELHQFAEQIGLQRRWFQNHPRHPHYDLPPSARAAAVQQGAVAVTTRELAKILQQGRDSS